MSAARTELGQSLAWHATCENPEPDRVEHLAAAALAWFSERLSDPAVVEAAKAAAKSQSLDRFAEDQFTDDARAWLAGFAARAVLEVVAAEVSL